MSQTDERRAQLAQMRRIRQIVLDALAAHEEELNMLVDGGKLVLRYEECDALDEMRRMVIKL